MFSIAKFKLQKAILLLVAALLVLSGLEPWTVIKCTFLTALIAGPGVFICRALINSDRDNAFFDIGLGSCVGIGVAAVSQQIFLPFDFSFGWLVPQIIYLYGYLGKKKYGKPEISSIDIRSMLFVALCAVLYLSDIHWFFSIIAVIIYVLTRYTRPVIVFFCIMTTFLATAFILPAGWYVNTDDRIFDSAWALLMHRFGYWSWYGASNIFVPYHWVTHGIAGIYADVLNLDPFIATSIVIPVLAATGLAMLLVAILQQYIPLKSAIKAACVIPLMGVIAIGRSISLDSSLLFGLAMVLVFSQPDTRFKSVGFRFVLQTFITYLAFSSKFSMGIIAAPAVGIWVLYRSSIRSASLRTGVIDMISLAFGSALSLVATFGFLSNDLEPSGFRRVTPNFGGITFANQIWANTNTFARSGSILTAIFGSIGFFIFVARLSQRQKSRNSSDLALLLVPPLIGTIIFYGTIAYSVGSYLRAGFWLAISFAVGITLKDFHVLKENQFRFALMSGISIFIGVVDYWIEMQSNSGKFYLAFQIFGWGFQLAATLLLSWIYLVWSFPRGRNKKVLIRKPFGIMVCIFLLVSFSGSDIYRLANLGFGNNDWDKGFGVGKSRHAEIYGTSEEIEAGNWMVENSYKDEIVATNHICPLDKHCNLDGETPIAAWTERRSLIEAERFVTGRAVDERLFGETTTQGHPNWVNERRTVSIEFANNPSEELLAKLQGWGVSWFWVDLKMTLNRSWDDFATVRFINTKVVLLELR